MILADLLKHLDYQCLNGDPRTEVDGLVYDSRKAEEGCVFVCISGARTDGHDFIDQVVKAGARAVVVEREHTFPEGVAVIKTENTRRALAYMSAAYFGYPAEELTTIGITGTKGKTTTTYMVKSILENAGFKTGLIGTIESIIGDQVIPAANTTPESYVVQKTFREMVDAGCDCVVMEVSSQGLMLDRVGGFVFDYGIFTNLEPDHIGPFEHRDLADYIRCKGLLFRQCVQGIVNADDGHLDQILEGHTCKVESFGFSEEADLSARDVKLFKEPGCLGVSYRLKASAAMYGEPLSMDVSIDIPGKFSVYNSLAAIAICLHFGVSEQDVRKALSRVTVKGRVEVVRVSDRYTMIIDYAHNAMSLDSLLTTLREYEPERLVCLFGCGGNRSKQRRFEMGLVSAKLADLTVVTSDNPRDEEPLDIIEDILTGIKKGPGEYVTIPDRKEAIRYCMEHARDGDVIVLAGKGHEDYQEIKGVKYKMDERDLIRDIMEEMGNGTLEG